MQTREGRGASSSIAQQLLHRPLAVGSRAERERRRRGGGGEEDSRTVPHLAFLGRCRRPWIRLTGGPGCTSCCWIRAWGGRGRSPTTGKEAAGSTPSPAGMPSPAGTPSPAGSHSSAPRPRRERTKLPFPFLRRARRGGHALSVEHWDLRRA
jgi:hypothetical protein